MQERADDPRLARRVAEPVDAEQRAEPDPEFRVDLERVRFSPYFSRLSAVTQVISQTGAGLAVHNRLTHSIKVAAVARAIAVRLRLHPDHATIERLGGCDPVVVQAAASAHDLGHPPFGHLGEQTLDRLAHERFGLRDGFEGNAQTFRILTRLDEHDQPGVGLNLTAAVRAAVLKYPWLRHEGTTWASGPGTPRGLAPAAFAAGAQKFSAYELDADDMRLALEAHPAIAPLRQTVECSVMDIADDIAYSLHDLDDFHRAGLLNQTAISTEFRAWARERATLRDEPLGVIAATDRQPGRSLELLWRRLEDKDPWIADPDAFAAAVARVTDEVVDGLLSMPFDGSLAAERALTLFTAAWITHLESSVTVLADPGVRAGHVSLEVAAWHEVAVLKFLHQRFILDRPDLAIYQRGQASVIERVVTALADWLEDDRDRRRAPRRLLDLVEIAAEDYLDLDPASQPDDGPSLVELARGRGVIDYVASLTDAQATSLDRFVTGGSDRLWEAGQGL